MVYDVDPLAVPEEAYRFGVNVALHKQAIGQRHGVREIPLWSDVEGLVEDFQCLNYQGGIDYSPGKGQSAIQFSSKGDFLAISAAGRKFLIEVISKGASVYGLLTEVTGDAIQAPDLHMSWMGQAENYLIAGDDFGATFIYDGTESAFLSDGYDPNRPDESKVPNRARLPVYTHGRVAMVDGINGVKIGDIIHGNGQTDASNILNFAEQIYWASGAELRPPTNQGPILAAYNLPTLGRTSDHGEFVLEASGGALAVATHVSPRTSWVDTRNMVVTVSTEGGARGPWSVAVYNDDAIRRTLNGVEALSFARRSSDIVYTPQDLLSEPISDYLAGDFGPELRFNQTKIHRADKRLYTTVRPWVSGAHWKHRGVATFNYKRKLWEGVSVYPEPVRDVKGLIPLEMDGEDRMFMVAGNEQTGNSIRILEIEPGLREDVLVDGTYPIQSSIYTRAVYGDLKETVTPDKGDLQFDRVLGDVNWRVLWKSDWSQGAWTPWATGTVCHDPLSAPGVKPVELPQFIGKEVNGVPLKAGRHFEFLVRWSGQADLRFHNVDVDSSIEQSDIFGSQTCTSDPYSCDNDPLLPWQ